MEDILVPIFVVGMLFIGLPWIIFHYVTKWKSASSITTEDENLMDELYDFARRLEDRLATMERLMQAEHPNWRATANDSTNGLLEDYRGRDRLSDEGLGRRPERLDRPGFGDDEPLGARSNMPLRRNQ